MDLETYKKLYEDDGAPGWDAINDRLDEFYPKDEPDGHWAPDLPYMIGGEDPLDGVSVYKNDTADNVHLHYISYGFSELYYEEDAVGEEFSKFGFELTFRLKPYKDDVELPVWVASLMQNLAKYVFKSGNIFDDYHYVPANGPIRLETETEICALAFVPDPELGEIETPHGVVKFLQMVGITQKEFDSVRAGTLDRFELVEKLRENNPLLITDLERKDFI